MVLGQTKFKQTSIKHQIAVVGMTTVGVAVGLFGLSEPAEARLAAANLVTPNLAITNLTEHTEAIAGVAQSEPCDPGKDTVLGSALNSIEAGGQNTSPLAQASVLVGAAAFLVSGCRWLQKHAS